MHAQALAHCRPSNTLRLRSSVLLVLLQRAGIRCARIALGSCHSNDNVVTGMRKTMFSHVSVFTNKVTGDRKRSAAGQQIWREPFFFKKCLIH